MSQTQTPIKKIVINLEQLYDLFGSPTKTACEILRTILMPYLDNADVVMLNNIFINVSPDVGFDVDLEVKDYKDLELKDKILSILNEEDIDVALEKIVELTKSNIIIELNDGYEKCITL